MTTTATNPRRTEKARLVFGAVADIYEIKSKLTLKRCMKLRKEFAADKVYRMNNFMAVGVQMPFVLEETETVASDMTLAGFMVGRNFFGIILTDGLQMIIERHFMNNRVRRYFAEHMKISEEHPVHSLHDVFRGVNIFHWQTLRDIRQRWD